MYLPIHEFHIVILGNYDIDFDIFHHRCFAIMKPKLLKFERDQNVTENFLIGINDSKILLKSVIVDKTIV